MANLEGREIEELATERLKQIIIEDVVMAEEGYFGQLLCQGWKDMLKGDPYFECIGGSKK